MVAIFSRDGVRNSRAAAAGAVLAWLVRDFRDREPQNLKTVPAMPPKPGSIKLNDLDTTILAALKNFSGGKIPGKKGPIINGIILNEAALAGLNPSAVAREIVGSLKPAAGVVLKPNVERLGDGRIIVGFRLQTKLG